MGINLEYITLLSSLNARKELPINGDVIELGAQDISAEPSAVAEHARRCGVDNSYNRINSAFELYKLYGFDEYACIDATAEHGALVFDLNKSLRDSYQFVKQYDLVTNLGTFEHVFDVASAFKNAHNLCKVTGLIIHAIPSNCNANHGYYTIQPRMIADIAAANDYEILDFLFTVDYKPTLYKFSFSNYKNYDDRDVMIYCVLRKKSSNEFQLPFDSIFTDKNTLANYQPIFTSLTFSSYIKSTWRNVRPKFLSFVPTKFQNKPPIVRTLIKKVINFLGGLF